MAGRPAVKAIQNVLLRGAGWDNCDRKKIYELLLDKKIYTQHNKKGKS